MRAWVAAAGEKLDAEAGGRETSAGVGYAKVNPRTRGRWNRVCMSAGNLEESNGVLQREGVLARHESRCEGCERCYTKPGCGLERLWFTARCIMPEEKHVEAVGTVPLTKKREPFCTDDSEELPREL